MRILDEVNSVCQCAKRIPRTSVENVSFFGSLCVKWRCRQQQEKRKACVKVDALVEVIGELIGCESCLYLQKRIHSDLCPKAIEC